jgi:rSAM/selenodomain-associated transferase 1
MSDNVKRLIIQFAKLPIAGQVKTRLIPLLGADAACALHTQLMGRTLSLLQGVPCADQVLYLAGDSAHESLNDWKNRSSIAWQQGDDLGERMSHALAEGLREYDQVLLVGSDCPVLTLEVIEQAFGALVHNDMVYCPAEDGGYVLVGAKQLTTDAFENIDWGTDQVMAQSIKQLNRVNTRFALLNSLWDVDRPEDVLRFEQM